MACLTVAMVTLAFLGCAFLVSAEVSGAAWARLPRRDLLGVLRSGLCRDSEEEARDSVSAISTARRQMSRARRASPETAATFRLANWMASGSTRPWGTR